MEFICGFLSAAISRQTLTLRLLSRQDGEIHLPYILLALAILSRLVLAMSGNIYMLTPFFARSFSMRMSVTLNPARVFLANLLVHSIGCHFRHYSLRCLGW